jgi:hypothetical protein
MLGYDAVRSSDHEQAARQPFIQMNFGIGPRWGVVLSPRSMNSSSM